VKKKKIRDGEEEKGSVARMKFRGGTLSFFILIKKGLYKKKKKEGYTYLPRKLLKNNSVF
jgi:hypothetical protein